MTNNRVEGGGRLWNVWYCSVKTGGSEMHFLSSLEQLWGRGSSFGALEWASGGVYYFLYLIVCSSNIVKSSPPLIQLYLNQLANGKFEITFIHGIVGHVDILALVVVVWLHGFIYFIFLTNWMFLISSKITLSPTFISFLVVKQATVF